MTGTRPRLDDAACRGREDLYLKDNPRAPDHDLMRKICATCWDRPECLTWALEREEHGYWAGHTAVDRRRLRAQYGIALRPIFAGAWASAPRGSTEGDQDGRDDAGAVAAVDRG